MTHEQIVAALERDFLLEDAHRSHRSCYPVRKPATSKTVRRMWDVPPPCDRPDPTGFGEGCVI